MLPATRTKVKKWEHAEKLEVLAEKSMDYRIPWK